VGVGRNSLTREEAVNIGVYSVGSQARVFFLHGISAPPLYLGRDFEQNGFSEKRGMVKLNRLSGHKIGESYRSGKRKSAEVFRKSERMCELRISRRSGKERKDCGTSGENFGMLNCEGLVEFNLRSSVSSCVAFSSCVAILYCVGISSYGGISSCAGISSCVTRSLQGSHSRAETHMRGEIVRHKIASRTSSLLFIEPALGSRYGPGSSSRASQGAGN